MEKELHLYENQIYPGVHYIDNTQYPMYSYGYGKCPKASLFSSSIITLPIHLNLKDKDISRVVKVLKEGIESI